MHWRLRPRPGCRWWANRFQKNASNRAPRLPKYAQLHEQLTPGFVGFIEYTIQHSPLPLGRFIKRIHKPEFDILDVGLVEIHLGLIALVASPQLFSGLGSKLFAVNAGL